MVLANKVVCLVILAICIKQGCCCWLFTPNGWQVKGYRPFPYLFASMKQASSGSPASYRDIAPVVNTYYPACGHNDMWKPTPSDYIPSSMRYDRPQYKLIGGKEAVPNEFPYQVLFIDAFRNYVCSGSLIAESWILTSARCMVNWSNDPIHEIVYGTNEAIDFSPLWDRPPLVRRLFSEAKRFVHPRYAGMEKLAYDFCLIKVDEPVDFTQSIQPICLPKSCDDTCQPGEFAIATGYVARNETSRILENVQIPIIPDTECEKQLVHMLYNETSRVNDTHSSIKQRPVFNPQSMFCAGNLTHGGVSICTGDSGGPFACYKNGYFQLDGLNGWIGGTHNECGLAKRPQVFSKVCAVIDWIKAIIATEDPAIYDAT